MEINTPKTNKTKTLSRDVLEFLKIYIKLYELILVNFDFLKPVKGF
jgi:hypothetical protein